jgi:hypothetical protein
LVIDSRIGTFFLEHKAIRENSKGTKYIPVNASELGHNEPVAVYANIDDIEAGKVYTLVQFKPSAEGETGMYALNEPTLIERMRFIGQVASETGLSTDEVKAELGL